MRRSICFKRLDSGGVFAESVTSLAPPPLLPSSSQVNSLFCLRPEALKPECWSTMSSRVHPKHVGTQCVFTPH